jgi:hypothetical protein
MTTPATPSAPQPSGDDRKFVPAATSPAGLDLEDRVHLFWSQNKQTVLIVIAAVFLGIIAKGGWEYYTNQKELGVQQEFAAANTPEKLKAFAAAHAGHALAGVAQLQLADQAYAAGKSAEAAAAYTQALTRLPAGPLASRAKLGSAMSSLQAGKTAEGETALKQIVADAAQPKGTRAEAAYHLASLAQSQGHNDDARKLCDQVSQIDPSGSWMQRAMMLRATLPPSA